MTQQNRLWLDWLILAVLIFIPRILNLDIFLTADEPLFLEHARSFAAGLSSGDLEQTLGIGYPGVTVAAWAAPVVNHAATELGAYTLGRLAVAFLSGLLMLALFGLARVLLGRWPALLGIALLALDPYTLGYSRLLHVAAPLALFMSLAGVSLLLWLRDFRLRWLTLAGLFSGLALLTKSTALLLLPMMGSMVLVWAIGSGTWRHKRWWWRVCLGTLTMAALAAVTFFVLWPAMWVDTARALSLTFGKLFADQEAGTGNLGLFWLGHFVEDPGLAFYPVAFVLKATPWLLIGLLLNIIFLAIPKFQGRDQKTITVSLWLFALTYILVMTFASKKSIRYMLPAFPTLYLLAGIAFYRGGDWVAARWLAKRRGEPLNKTLVQFGLVGGLIFLVAFAFVYHPYYFSYYNPAVLGWRWAPDTLLVGWGEGLDDAARHLNQRKPEAVVAAWYEWLFPLYYHGSTEAVVPQENLLTADHAVLYINQVQRDIPSPNIIHYFQTRRVPEYTVRLNGIDYAWVYPGPVVGPSVSPQPQFPVTGQYDDAIQLVGYSLSPEPISGGQPVVVTLFWQVLAPPNAQRFVFLRLVDDQGRIWANVDGPPVMGLWPVDRWQPGVFLEDAHSLSIPAGTPPGVYRLEVGLYELGNDRPLSATGQPAGPGGGLILGDVAIEWRSVTRPDSNPAMQIEAQLSPAVSLLGYSPPPGVVRTGEQLHIDMLWQENRSWWQWGDSQENSVQFSWFRNNQIISDQLDSLPLPVDQWGKEGVLRSQHSILVPSKLESGRYQLRAALHNGSEPAGDAVVLAEIDVTAPPHKFEIPGAASDPTEPAQLALVPEGRISLAGYTLLPEDDALELSLFWQTDTAIPTNYTVFAQLISAEEKVVAQSDSVPAAGIRPTASWIPGEIITDLHVLPIPAGEMSGPYRLIAGLYDPISGQRLPLVDTRGSVVGDAITVTEVTLP